MTGAGAALALGLLGAVPAHAVSGQHVPGHWDFSKNASVTSPRVEGDYYAAVS